MSSKDRAVKNVNSKDYSAAEKMEEYNSHIEQVSLEENTSMSSIPSENVVIKQEPLEMSKN